MVAYKVYTRSIPEECDEADEGHVEEKEESHYYDSDASRRQGHC